MTKAKKPDIKKDVLKKITSEEVKMHSHAYFVLLSIATVVSIVSVTLLAAIFTRILIDDVNTGLKADLFDLGGRGRNAFVTNFPWGLLILTVLAVYLTVRLFKKREISYKHGMTIFYGSVVAAVVILSVIVGALKVDEPFKDSPIIDRFKTLKSLTEERTIGGIVDSINSDSIILQTREGKTVEIRYNKEEIRGELRLGAPVAVFGEYNEEDEVFEAEFVKFGGPMKMLNGEIKGDKTRIKW